MARTLGDIFRRYNAGVRYLPKKELQPAKKNRKAAKKPTKKKPSLTTSGKFAASKSKGKRIGTVVLKVIY